LLDFAGDRVEIEVRCSAGTYVRAIARDLGEKLGTGGHLTMLRRTRSGAFDLSQAVTGDDLASAAGRVVPLSCLLGELPAVQVFEASRRLLKNGRDLGPDAVAGFPELPPERVRLVDATGRLLALAVPRGFASGPSELPRFPVLHPDVVLLDD
jgi:tRNA pseudouridine55 synthase